MYARSLETHPILTKTLTSSSIAALGNIIAQLVFERRAQGPAFRFQVLNVLRMAGFSAIIAPCIHKWYQFLDKVFGNTSKAMSLLKLLTDQTLFAGFINSLFFTYMSIVHGNPKDIPNRLKKDVLPTLKASWKLWPLAQLINFNLVPPRYRVLFGNGVGFVWNIFLSIVGNK